MKRHGNLWPNVVSFEALLHAAEQARLGKRFRPAVMTFEFNLERELWRLHEELCFNLVADLRKRWDGVLWHNPDPTPTEQRVIAELTGRRFLYRRLGHDERPMRLERGAKVGEGRVVACEPNSVLAEKYLPQNLARNGFYHGVEICPKVIGNLDDRTVDFVLHEGDFATSSLERWAYAHRREAVRVPAITLDRHCADWPRLDLVKIDAEGAEALIWEGMQKTLRRFPHAAVVLELHLQRDPPQVTSFLRQLERDGFGLRYINYEGEVVATDSATVLANPQEHWTLWLLRGYITT
jgi:FkbM family methyltransferase